MIRGLPYHDLPVQAGLTTRFTQRATAGQGLVQAQNVDSYALFRALGKVPGASLVSSGSVVDSLHQFEHTALTLERRRHQIISAGGKLHRIEDDGSRTELYDGLAKEPLTAAAMLNRLYLSGPSQSDLDTGGLRYDGTLVRKWGVLGPGQYETPIDGLNAPAWSGSSDVSLSADDAVKIKSEPSIRVDKTGATEDFAQITRTYSPSLDLSPVINGEGIAYVWLFLPYGMLQKLDSQEGVQVRFESSGSPSVPRDHHSFSPGELLPGWNLLSCILDSPSLQLNGGADFSDVERIRLRINLTSSSVTFDGVRWDFLHYTDDPRPTPVQPGNVLDEITASDWSPLGGASLAAETDNTIDGEESLKVDKTGTSDAFATAVRQYTGALDLTVIPDDLLHIWLYVPENVLSSLPSTGTFQINLSDSTNTDGNVHDVDADDLSSGWNHLELDLTAPSSTNGSGADLSSVERISLRVNTSAAGDTFSGILWDWLSYRQGNIDGLVSYRVTYLTETGLESNAGSPSLSVSPVGDRVILRNIPVSPDPQVIGRRIYRDSQDDRLFRFVVQIDDNTTTEYEDNTEDGALSSETPPIAGDSVLDSSPPGVLSDVVVHEGRIVGISADDRFTLLISEPNTPDAFRVVDQLQFEEELVSLEEHHYGTAIYGRDRLFILEGDGVSKPFRVTEVNSELGANNFRSTCRIKALNMAIREKEMFLVSNPADPWLINGSVLDLFEDDEDIEDAFVLHDRSRFRVIVFSGLKAYVYQYGTRGLAQVSGEGQGTDPQDVRLGLWYTLDFPSLWQAINCAALVEKSSEKPEVWVGTRSGGVYRIQDPDETEWETLFGLTSPVSSVIEWSPVPLGADIGGRGEPRYLKVDTVASEEQDWTVTVQLLTGAEGSVVKTKSFTLTVPSGSSSQIVPIPYIGARAEWCKVKLENASSGSCLFTGPLTLYYIPRFDFRGRRSA